MKSKTQAERRGRGGGPGANGLGVSRRRWNVVPSLRTASYDTGRTSTGVGPFVLAMNPTA